MQRKKLSKKEIRRRRTRMIKILRELDLKGEGGEKNTPTHQNSFNFKIFRMKRPNQAKKSIRFKRSVYYPKKIK